ncbi:hypothetical protein ScPMuIL_007517 [Solemya velum]
MQSEDEDDDSAPLLHNSIADKNGGQLNRRLKVLCVDVSVNEEISGEAESWVSPPTSPEHDTSDCNSSASTGTPTFSLRGLSSRKKFILASTCWCDLSTYMCLSVMAPFFPEEALAKNVDNTISGWIFGTYALSQVFCSPLFGKLLPSIGPRFMYLAGSFLAGGCTVLFGLIVYVPVNDSPIVFIVLCFILRAFLAIGCSAQQTAAFTICAIEFPDTITTVFGIGEVFVGIGTMVGPAFGGVLYELGGFALPFYVLGGMIIVSLPLNMWMLPKDEELKPSTNKVSFLLLLKLPMTFITSLDIVVVAVVWAILDPTLEPHLREFNLTPELVGAIFLLMAAFYAISSPIWGWLADKMPDNRYLLIPGFIITALGSMLLGPSPFFGIENALWLNMVSLIILGVSTSMALIPTFDIYIDLAEGLGIEDDFAVYSIVAGLWGSMYALGDFIGPSIGGFLFDSVGFGWMMTYIAAACVIMSGLLSFTWLYEVKCSKRKKKPPGYAHGNSSDSIERTSLLNNNTDIHGTPNYGNIENKSSGKQCKLTNMQNGTSSQRTSSSQIMGEALLQPISALNADIMGQSMFKC